MTGCMDVIIAYLQNNGRIHASFDVIPCSLKVQEYRVRSSGCHVMGVPVNWMMMTIRAPGIPPRAQSRMFTGVYGISGFPT